MALVKHSRSWPLIGVAARVALAAAAVLAMAAIQRLGSLLGSLAWRVPGRLREGSRLNVAMCLPELSQEQRDRMVRLSLQETGRSAVEMAAVWARPFEWSAGLVDGVVGHELLQAAAGGGRGAVLLLPHLGNWEMFSAYLERYGELLALYRPARVHEVDRLILRAPANPAPLRCSHR